VLGRKRNQEDDAAAPVDTGASPTSRPVVWIVLVGATAVVGSVVWGPSGWLLDRAGSVDPRVLDGIIALLVVVPSSVLVALTRRQRNILRAREQTTRLLRDPLTGLPGRHALTEALPELLGPSGPRSTRTAVLFLDLDGFKTVNETHGHEVGDRLMAAVGKRLGDDFGAGRFLARYSGDEFVVVDPAAGTTSQGARLAGDLVRSIERPFDIGDDRIVISVHVGVAFASAGDDAASVLEDVDTAKEVARTRPDRVAVFEPAMRSRLTTRNAQRRLDDALRRGRFRLFYQPLVSLNDRTILGAEALLRWADPARGFVRASEFMPALEETGLIVPIGRWVLQESCRQAQRWADITPTGRRPVRVSVNISPRQLAQADFVDILRESIEASGADAGQIHLELSESTLVADPRLTWSTLNAARKVGVGLVLDDFGTGYSAISHLRDFDFELVKLDRSLVLGLGKTPENDVVIAHIVALARSLGIATVAEGVSEETQVARLIDLGCQLGQGQYFADSLPAPFIGQLIARNPGRMTVVRPSAGAGYDPYARGTIVEAARRSGAV
jgi:diguanylate cyclase (GGDEF)-like protein